MSALETLSHYDSRMHPTAMRILFTLRLLQDGGYNILFCWVPSHVGITGNETADYAAKSSSCFLVQGLPYSDIKKHFSCRIFSSWQGTWDLQIHNKLHSIKPTVCLWPILSIREVDVKLTRLRIGHTRFTHRYLIFGERIPICSTCRVCFTVRHILVECPGFNSHRVQFFQSSSITMQDLVEARKLVNDRTPKSGISYSSALNSIVAPSSSQNMQPAPSIINTPTAPTIVTPPSDNDVITIKKK
ncbi:hypothetical protein AVEN_45877-1 [Araneus ventricosus]|uniref:Uncharacterized protein n=1 Tax=Araneus ventricosus TaxID=182803 RepID=A0A4Y2SCT1_ARAVE|nr:hypothetical protein AVEN_45877-1 [Araneus ventricosus]